MKTIALLLTVVVLALPVLAGDHPGKSDSSWFDMEGCEFCKNLTADPELLHHLTWECHKISNCMLNITTVDPEYADAFATANKAMEKLGSDMMSGAVNPMQVKMCGHCAAFGQLLMAGAEMEVVPGEVAEVSLITSSDPALVTRIHEFTDHNNQEMAAMKASGHGHDHPSSH